MYIYICIYIQKSKMKLMIWYFDILAWHFTSSNSSNKEKLPVNSKI